MKMKRRSKIPTFEHLEARTVLATFVVSNFGDGPVSTDGDQPGTLRQAIYDANANPGPDIIDFTIDNGDIVLTSGLLLVKDALQINGPGTSLAVSGNKTSRVFVIDDGDNSGQFDFVLDSLTVKEGHTISIGGGILSRENLTIRNARLEDNFSEGEGGGLFAEVVDGAFLEITDSEFARNASVGDGGGAYIDTFSGGVTTLTGNVFASNRVAPLPPTRSSGAGLFTRNFGVLKSSENTYERNVASSAGGGANIENHSVAELAGETFNDNRADAGGGLRLLNSGERAEVANSKFTNNSARLGGGAAAHRSMFDGVEFRQNDAREDGGGFWGSNVEFKDAVFQANSAGREGGGASITGAEFNGAVFDSNTATFGGGLSQRAGAPSNLTSASFVDNQASSDGGGLYLIDTTAVLNGVVLRRNSSNGHGGGVFCRGGRFEIINSAVVENTAGGWGGGLALLTRSKNANIIRNTTISNNAAVRDGGGVYYSSNDNPFKFGRVLQVENSTIVENTADVSMDFAGVGGGIFHAFTSDGTVELTNTLIAKNIYFGVGVEFDIGGLFSNVSAEHSVIGIDPGISGANNVAGVFTDPLDPLIAPLADNGGETLTHALLSGSPAIDRGDPAFDTAELMWDQRGPGYDRVINNRVDVGAFEVQLDPPVIGDANRDGRFDSGDLVAVFQAGEYEDGIPQNSTYEEGDWNGDGDFDTSDLVLAFQQGNYVASARPLVSDLAAAIDAAFDEDDEIASRRRSTPR